MVTSGMLGKINMIDLRYAHGFGCDPEGDVKAEGQKWRVDPKKVGRAFVLGDLSTHTYYMSQLICPDQKLKQVLCDRQAFVGSRYPLEDNAYVLMRYEDGAVGRMWCSCVNAGDMSSQHIRIVGSKASIEWDDERPNQMTYEIEGEPVRVLERGAGYLYPEARVEDRIGGGHAEGLFEAWANLYRRFAVAMDAANNGEEYGDFWYPNVESGAQGVKWIEKCVESADNGAAWVSFD